MENNNEDGSHAGIKVIFLISLLLLVLDLFEFTSTLTNVLHLHQIYPIETFNECIKYQSIAQAFFALFGSSAAVSACLLSLGLIISFDFFLDKMLECFLYFNYFIFGPLLLGACFLGGYYFKQFAYVCNVHQEKHLHVTMAISLFFSFIISVSITVIYSMIYSTSLLYQSIRLQRDGNVLLGKLFWFFIQNRVRSSFNNQVNDRNDPNPNAPRINRQSNQEALNEELPTII